MFLHSILTYHWLVPEAFMADGNISQEKLVWFAMSFMLKDTAARQPFCSRSLPGPDSRLSSASGS
jgi:hypothetical protein